MTIAMAVRVGRNNCALAVDGRIVAGSRVCTERQPKFYLAPSGGAVAVFAGSLAGLQACARGWYACKPESLSDFLEALTGNEWQALLWLPRQGLFELDNTGACLRVHDQHATIGSGSGVAWGFLSASVQPKDFKQARNLLRSCGRVVAKYDNFVGPKLTLLDG